MHDLSESISQLITAVVLIHDYNVNEGTIIRFTPKEIDVDVSNFFTWEKYLANFGTTNICNFLSNSPKEPGFYLWMGYAKSIHNYEEEIDFQLNGKFIKLDRDAVIEHLELQKYI